MNAAQEAEAKLVAEKAALNSGRTTQEVKTAQSAPAEEKKVTLAVALHPLRELLETEKKAYDLTAKFLGNQDTLKRQIAAAIVKAEAMLPAEQVAQLKETSKSNNNFYWESLKNALKQSGKIKELAQLEQSIDKSGWERLIIYLEQNDADELIEEITPLIEKYHDLYKVGYVFQLLDITQLNEVNFYDYIWLLHLTFCWEQMLYHKQYSPKLTSFLALHKKSVDTVIIPIKNSLDRVAKVSNSDKGYFRSNAEPAGLFDEAINIPLQRSTRQPMTINKLQEIIFEAIIANSEPQLYPISLKEFNQCLSKFGVFGTDVVDPKRRLARCEADAENLNTNYIIPLIKKRIEKINEIISKISNGSNNLSPIVIADDKLALYNNIKSIEDKYKKLDVIISTQFKDSPDHQLIKDLKLVKDLGLIIHVSQILIQSRRTCAKVNNQPAAVRAPTHQSSYVPTPESSRQSRLSPVTATLLHNMLTLVDYFKSGTLSEESKKNISSQANKLDESKQQQLKQKLEVTETKIKEQIKNAKYIALLNEIDRYVNNVHSDITNPSKTKKYDEKGKALTPLARFAINIRRIINEAARLSPAHSLLATALEYLIYPIENDGRKYIDPDYQFPIEIFKDEKSVRPFPSLTDTEPTSSPRPEGSPPGALSASSGQHNPDPKAMSPLSIVSPRGENADEVEPLNNKSFQQDDFDHLRFSRLVHTGSDGVDAKVAETHINTLIDILNRYDQTQIGIVNANGSTQLTSLALRKILSALKTLPKFPSNDDFILQIIELITNKISCAGIIQKDYLQGTFHNTLIEIFNYLNDRLSQEKRFQNLDDMFTPSVLKEEEFNATHHAKSKNAIVAKCLMLVDYYLNTPIGKKIATQSGIPFNILTADNNYAKTLLRRIEQSYFYDVPDDQFVAIIVEELDKIYVDISNANSVFAIEIKAIANAFRIGISSPVVRPDKELEKLFGRALTEKQASNYINQHFIQRTAKLFLEYGEKSTDHYLFKTAKSKEKARHDIEVELNNLYLQKSSTIKTKYKQLQQAEHRNVLGLVWETICNQVESNLDNYSAFYQGFFAVTLSQIKQYIKKTARIHGNAVEQYDNQDDRRFFRKFDNIVSPKSNTPQDANAVVASNQSQGIISQKAESLNVLVARILALVDYYLKADMSDGLMRWYDKQHHHGSTNNDIGFLKIFDNSDWVKEAKELANFARQMYVDNPYNAKGLLQEKTKSLITQLRSPTILGSIFGEEDCPFANALEGIINTEKQELTSFPVKAKDINLFIANENSAKDYIQRHIIDEVRAPYRKFQASFMGSFSFASKTVQQHAANETYRELTRLSKLSLKDREAEMEKKCKPHKPNFRDSLIRTIGDPILKSGVIADCYLQGNFGAVLTTATDFLNNLKISTQKKSIKQLLNTEKVFSFDQDFSKRKPTMKELAANLMVISDYYLNTPLGQQIADNAGVSYNTKKNRWSEQAKILADCAMGGYANIDHKDQAKCIQVVLENIRQIIRKIRSSWSGSDSRLANELAKILNFYAKSYSELKVESEPENKYRFENADAIIRLHMGDDNADDYMHKNMLQNTAKYLNEYKNAINTRHSTSSAKYEIVKTIDNNIDGLYRKTLQERQELIGKVNDTKDKPCLGHIIQEYVQKDVPYSLSPQKDEAPVNNNMAFNAGKFGSLLNNMMSFIKCEIIEIPQFDFDSGVNGALTMGEIPPVAFSM